MKLKNIPWILFFFFFIVIGLFYDRVLNLPSEGFQDLGRAMIVILMIFPVLFFFIGYITNYKDPVDWFQLVVLAVTLLIGIYVKTGKIELDPSWVVPGSYPLFNILGIFIGKWRHQKKLGLTNRSN